MQPSRESDWEDPELWELDQEIVKNMLIQLQRRFVDERIAGYVDPRTGQKYHPVSRAEAEARWAKAAVVLSHTAQTFDRDIVSKLSTYRYKDARARTKHAEMDEPSLRRGESLVAQVCGKQLQS